MFDTMINDDGCSVEGEVDGLALKPSTNSEGLPRCAYGDDADMLCRLKLPMKSIISL